MVIHAVIAFAALVVQDHNQEQPEDKRTVEARAVMQKGFDAIQEAKAREGDEKKKGYEEAIVHFRKIVKEYSDTKVYGMCHFNIAAILCDFLEKYEDAIVEFKAIIDSNVDDKDDTGQLMSPYRNYRYHSWRLITTCYEKLKKPAHAFEAALKSLAASSGWKQGDVNMAVRLAVTGTNVGPPLYESIVLLGRERSLERLDRAVAALS